MKIAFVYDAVYPYRIGGVEKRIYELSRRLARRGHEVHIFGLKEWEGDPTFIKEGVYYHGLGESRRFYIRGRRSIKEALYFGWKVLTPLLNEHFDIIDCQNFPYFSCFSAGFAAKIRGSHLVITWHEVWGEYWYEYLGLSGIFGRIIEKNTAKLSNNRVAVSESTKKDLLSLGNPAAVAVIPNGIDFQEINTIKPSDIFSDIIFSGRLIKEKRIDLLVQALGILKKEIQDIKCIIIGEGPEKMILQKITQDSGLDENIHFMGYLQDHNELLGLFKSSKVFVSPSVREGFGITALEALGCGLPVVTVNSPGNAVRELLNEMNGIICSLSPVELAESIKICLERRIIMSESCIMQAKIFDWEIISGEIERYYESIGMPD
jgi:glycosyltransferase involved in cell wall biosynthesis